MFATKWSAATVSPLVVLGVTAFAFGCAARPPQAILVHGPPCPEPRGMEALAYHGLLYPSGSTTSPGTTLVSGLVKPKDRGQEIIAVQVFVPNSDVRVEADIYGRYELEIPDDLEGELHFQRIGYVSEALPLEVVRSRGRVDVELLTCPIYIDRQEGSP